MKSAKPVLGIISIVFFIIITVQSFITGIVNAIDNNTRNTSGGVSVLPVFAMLVSGIAVRSSKGDGITVGIYYVISAIISFVNRGTFGDLII